MLSICYPLYSLPVQAFPAVFLPHRLTPCPLQDLAGAQEHQGHAVTLCRVRTSCTTLAGQMGTPPQRASGRSTSSSEHSGRVRSGSHCDKPGLLRHRRCFVKTASGGSSFDSGRKPALHEHRSAWRH